MLPSIVSPSLAVSYWSPRLQQRDAATWHCMVGNQHLCEMLCQKKKGTDFIIYDYDFKRTRKKDWKELLVFDQIDIVYRCLFDLDTNTYYVSIRGSTIKTFFVLQGLNQTKIDLLMHDFSVKIKLNSLRFLKFICTLLKVVQITGNF